MINFESFKEAVEVVSKRLEDSPLGKLSEGKIFDKPMSEYDKPLWTDKREDLILNPDADFTEAVEVEKPENYDKIEAIRDGSTHDESIEGPRVNPQEVEKPKDGGSYNEVKANSDSSKHEVHHMPADSATETPYGDGPAIKMDKTDHKQTASCGNSKEAQEYRQKQKELIEQGKYDEALQMDIDDIHEKFGDKYDDAIAEMKEYIEKKREEGYEFR